jgi:rare lipoprotein A (peptidoglycan hydrolase)
MSRAFSNTIRAALLAGLLCVAGAGSAASALAETGGTSSASAVALKRPTTRRASIATWFGPGFYGKRTACGQMLTPAVVGVANRTLPCGTLVTFSYRARAVTVPVIDRGPYANGADWDLTSQAAQLLGVLDTVRVRWRVVGRVPNNPALGVPPAPGEPPAPAPGVALTGGAGTS